MCDGSVQNYQTLRPLSACLSSSTVWSVVSRLLTSLTLTFPCSHSFVPRTIKRSGFSMSHCLKALQEKRNTAYKDLLFKQHPASFDQPIQNIVVLALIHVPRKPNTYHLSFLPFSMTSSTTRPALRKRAATPSACTWSDSSSANTMSSTLCGNVGSMPFSIRSCRQPPRISARFNLKLRNINDKLKLFRESLPSESLCFVI